MHDPMTVAHEIKWPIKNKYGYREPVITIWHIDPDIRGDDDSCGYSFPKITDEERVMIRKLAHNQYGQLFEKDKAEIEHKSYAYICSNQDSYGVVYWSWRAIKHIGKKGWQYGKELSLSELQYVYNLYCCPNDNLKNSLNSIKTESDYANVLYLIFRCYKRYSRKWYQHPRWHIHHWRVQFNTFQKLKRRYWDKCSVCGKRGFKSSANSDWNGTKIWHSECDTSSQNIVD